jgi:hypothetical protein
LREAGALAQFGDAITAVVVGFLLGLAYFAPCRASDFTACRSSDFT